MNFWGLFEHDFLQAGVDVPSITLPTVSKKKKTPHRPKSVARELIPCRHFEPARVKPN